MTTMEETEFATLFDRHRRELHVHCYRMLGSFDEAEDQVQETFLRAWRARERFEGEQFRAWLYKIATNATLDSMRRAKRRVPSVESMADVPWLQPYPDRLLDEIAPREDEPDALVVARETIELSFLALIQLLPPRQRAVLLLRDVLEWSAEETAAALDLTVQSANSALQRARATLKQQGRKTQEPTPAEQDLLLKFIDAHERADARAALAIAREDIRIAMPPLPMRFTGHDEILPLMTEGLTGPGEWRLVATSANRLPAAACYLREWEGTEFKAFKLDVLRIEDGMLAEITTFNAELFPQFGLSPTLPG
jgi:RNA polymerase sigma-70 factor (ECF subfamily)